MSGTSWLILCFTLVLLMQAGFTCLESGQVRLKNSVNVAMKNIADFVITIAAFWVIGYGVMFGDSFNGLFGTNLFFMDAKDSNADLSFFLFQATFSATAVTLTAGAVSERIKFSAYLLMVLLVCVVIYPLFGHWAWGGIANPDNMGFLQKLGFVDFAGSTVVHSLGGWVALAAVLIVGPRVGRFSQDTGRVVLIYGSNYSLAMLGAFLLIIGWVGFNAGSALVFSEEVPGIVFNTMLAASTGGVLMMVLSYFRGKHMDAMEVLNGVLAGLVAITAGCHIVSAFAAVVIGAVGSLVYLYVSNILKIKGIDDVIDVVPVHLGAGIWGTLAVAIFGDIELLANHSSRIELFGAQLTGIVVCGIFSFSVAYIALFQLDKFYRIRVGIEQERVGLDIAEHGIPDPLKVVAEQIEDRLANYGITEEERSVYSTTDETISGKYEHIIGAMEKHLESRQAELDHAKMLSNNDALTDLANRRFYDLSIVREFNRAYRYKEPLSLVVIDVDRFKQFNDNYGHHIGDKCLITIAELMKDAFKRTTDMIARLGGDEFAVIMPNTNSTVALQLCEEFSGAINSLKLENKNSPLEGMVITVSTGIATYNPHESTILDASELYVLSDKNMYRAKKLGRNRIAL